MDRVVSVLLFLEGILLSAGGFFLNQAADASFSEEIVANMGTKSTLLSESVLVDTIHNLTFWGGVGMVATGLLLVVASVTFPRFRRERRHDEADAVRTATETNVVFGAIVTAVILFFPLAPTVGGGVTGYYQGENGTKSGAVAGLVASTLLVVLLAFPIGGAVAAGAAPIAGLLTVTLVAGVVYVVGLSALGGYVGATMSE